MHDNVTSELLPVISPGHTGVADVFRAIGHPVRIELLRTLAKGGQACCGDLVGTLPLAQSTVSQHLGVLKAVGLIRCEVQGRCCRYSLDRQAIEGLSSVVAELFSALSQAPVESLSASAVGSAVPREGETTLPLSNACLPRRKDLP